MTPQKPSDPCAERAVGRAIAPESYSWLSRIPVVLAIAACSALLVIKFLLANRININWDEFNFLSHVHELARGELTLLMQGSYTHLFRWVTWVDTNEAGQIVAARVAMLMLLALTAALIWKLASLWASKEAAAIAPLLYLSASPVLLHGASFRYDSLIAPLSVLIALFLARRPTSIRSTAMAGVCMGAAAAISIKSVFLLPVVTGLFLADRAGSVSRLRDSFNALVTLTLVASITLGVVLLLHESSLAPAGPPALNYVSDSMHKAILGTTFAPRITDYYSVRDYNSVAWYLILAGGICSILRQRYWKAAACGLSLLPILFYRNAWSYYYVVMLAPAAVLAAVAVDVLRQLLQRFHLPGLTQTTVVVITLLLCWNAASHVATLWPNRQIAQRATIDAVHRIFAAPVPYIDHCGMIASFRKVNFLMSTWGLEDYRASGRPFMPGALSSGAPLLLANRPVLDPSDPMFRRRLLQGDRELLTRFYQPYWGPIYIAGVNFELGNETAMPVALPFPGKYRIESDAAILLNGIERQPGDIVEFTHSTAIVGRARQGQGDSPHQTVRLLWAAAGPAPREQPPSVDELFRPLR